MSEIDLEKMIQGIRTQLEKEGAPMDGLSIDELGAALAHPKAAEEIRRTLEREARSPQTGDPAPDFDLPRLTGPQAGERVRLSERCASRPVALIFGSYT